MRSRQSKDQLALGTAKETREKGRDGDEPLGKITNREPAGLRLGYRRTEQGLLADTARQSSLADIKGRDNYPYLDGPTVHYRECLH